MIDDDATITIVKPTSTGKSTMADIIIAYEKELQKELQKGILSQDIIDRILNTNK